MSLPNIPPKLFTLSAVALGYLLIDDLTANEQNALGNWLMLTAQVLCTNALYKQVEAERRNGPNNINVETLEKMIYALKKELEELKKMS
ncbi:putative uncharacterized protein [Firmicutes bacterium CAG:884]|nr:hypothetical protein [Bacillota bacterium]CCY93541.1 putative uncharacterized protein [Firmicutes bacterium CAG:884]